VVTQDAVIMTARYILGILTEQEILRIDGEMAIANTAVTSYAGTGRSLRLVEFNDVSHLDATPAPVTEEPDATAVG
jgi:hypothetical protein